MDKENVVCVYNGVLPSSFKKEGNPVICDNMDEPGKCKVRQARCRNTNTNDTIFMRNLKLLTQKVEWCHQSREETGYLLNAKISEEQQDPFY